tara:strand:+ start:497 stop:700 length:204 start_codon:yes stop_codon:yes gene_type:complete
MIDKKLYVFELITEKLEHIEIKATSIFEAEELVSCGEYEEEAVTLKDERFHDLKCIGREKLEEENKV